MTKGYKSNICIGGKRLSAMRDIVQSVFEDSLLSLEVDRNNRVFILRIDNRSVDKVKDFSSRYKLCRIIVYQEIPFSCIKK